MASWWFLWLAQGASPEIPFGPATWAQYGPATVSASVFAGVAWILFRALLDTLKRERDRGDRLETEIRELNKSIHERYIPALTTVMAEAARLTQVTADTTRALQNGRGTDR